MTHEFKAIIKAYIHAKENGFRSVLATVTALDGSSYRKPGVRMLILEDHSMIGAVSGGCVEKDILVQSQYVFKTGRARMMTYDGRYRLGCEGILYILLEEFQPSALCIAAFNNCLKSRNTFKIHSYYKKKECISEGLGSLIQFNKESFLLSEFSNLNIACLKFSEILPAPFKLMIFGAEHDAVQLCKLASFNGWEVSIIAGPLESKTIDNFPGATGFHAVSPDNLEINSIDYNTAIVIMSHNYSVDLKYLLELQHSKPAYIGLLGPSKRREKLLSQFIEYCPEIDLSFIEQIYGPAGLNIGAETPQEIAISIISEILAVTRNKHPLSLKEKNSAIHSNN